MKRREFFKKSGVGLAGVFASRLTFLSSKEEKRSESDTLANPIDFESIRQDFPPLQRYRAYMDTAFVGLMSKQVKAAHDEFLEERFQFGPFPVDKTILGVWVDRTEKVRKKLASFLGAKDKEIAFTYSTSCGMNIALNGIDWKKGDNAVIDDLDYPTDFHVLNSLKKSKGIEVRIVRNKNGAVAPKDFEAFVDKRTRALVVSHVSYLNGFRHNLKKLAELIHSYGGYLVVDSAQGVGGIKVDVKEEGVDLYSSIPYKWLNGPNGAGFLYIREDLIPSFPPDRLGWSSAPGFKSQDTMESTPFPDHASRFEYASLGYESIYALDAALDYINRMGIEVIEQRNIKLISMLRERLREKGVKFYTPENNRSPILSFFMENEKELGEKMKEKKIYITARKGHVRVSPHFYNNEKDIEAFIEVFSSVHRS